MGAPSHFEGTPMSKNSYRLLRQLEWWWTHRAITEAGSGWWAHRASVGTFTTVVVGGGLTSLGKGGEFVGEGNHAIAGERIVSHVVDVGGGDGALNIFLLLKDVEHADLQTGVFAFEELIAQRGIPEPLLRVVARRHTGSGAKGEVGAQHEPERSGVGAIKHTAIGVHIAIIGGVHRIVGGLEAVARTQFHVHPIATIGDSRR